MSLAKRQQQKAAAANQSISSSVIEEKDETQFKTASDLEDLSELAYEDSLSDSSANRSTLKPSSIKNDTPTKKMSSLAFKNNEEASSDL